MEETTVDQNLSVGATTEAPATDATGGILDVVAETATYAVYKDTSETETDPKKIKYGFGELKEGNALWKAAFGETKNGVVDTSKVDTEILFQVAVSYPVVHTTAGISQVVPDEEEAVSIFNKGLQAKILTKLRAYLQETDETGLVHATETSFDATEFAAEPMKRRAMTDTQKAVKVLSGLSKDKLAEALKAMGIL